MSRKPYFIIFEDNMYKVDPDLFSEHSQRFKEEYAQNPDQISFKENVAKETFEAFISSCQLRTYTIADSLILELLEVYRNWKCFSLEAQCYNECKKRGLRPRPREDYIGILLEKCDNNQETVEDLRNVAGILNDNWDDDRLPDIEPELLYRIVVLAEKKEMDMEKLKDFVMKLYETSPESAVLLTLRLDFDHLSESELETIFQCNEMHEISIGFFVAASLSAIRNKTKDNLVDSEVNHIAMMNDFLRQMDYDRRHMIMRLDKEHRDEMEFLINRIKKQHETIERLSDILCKSAEKLSSGSLSPRGIGDPKLMEIRDEVDERLTKIYNQTQADIEDNITEATKIFENSVAKIEKEWEEESADPTKIIADTERTVAIADQKIGEFNKTLDQIQKTIRESKGSIAAKIVRDHIRFSSGLLKDVRKKKSGSKFDLFKGTGSLWDLSANEVKEQVRTVKELENMLDMICPIRGAATRKKQ
jgi:uncharacterized protein YukE